MTKPTEAAEAQAFAMLTTPRPIAEYHEDMGPVLWWKFPIVEEPYVGGPNDVGYTVETAIECRMRTHMDPRGKQRSLKFDRQVGGWPGYHTHFTPIPKVKAP